MSDLVVFLRARLDEDEAAARAAAGRAAGDYVWVAVDPVRQPGLIGTVNGDVVVYSEGSPTVDEAAHITRHDPARVLREVEAKRVILKEHAPDPDSCCRACVTTRDRWKEDWPLDEWPCQTILAIATIYRDHPDYDPAWATSGSSR